MSFPKFFLVYFLEFILVMFAGFAFVTALYIFPHVFLEKTYYIPGFIKIFPALFTDLLDWPLHKAKEAVFYAALIIGFINLLLYLFIEIFYDNSIRVKKITKNTSETIDQDENEEESDWHQFLHPEFDAEWSQSEKSKINPIIFNLATVLATIVGVLVVEWLVGVWD